MIKQFLKKNEIDLPIECLILPYSFFQKPFKMIRNQSSMLFLKKLLKKEYPVDELYLLVHPHYNHTTSYKNESYHKIWMESISKNSQKEGVFAIMYFNGLPSDKDESDKLKFYYEKPNELELELARLIKKSFGKDRYKFVMIQNIYPYTCWTYDENIKTRMVDSIDIKLTARGVYAERCVLDAVMAAIEVYQIPSENAEIIFSESVFGEKSVKQKTQTTKDLLKDFNPFPKTF